MGDTTPINKDLFYSGHTASLFIMFFIARNRVWKIICFIGAIIVPVLLVWQRVHYTIDVLFAPLAAYCVWWFIEYLHENSSFGLNAVFDKRQD
jgi:membrane-associated phospholipid phosphatase